jgi:CheY-like chemotaxis protein
MPALAGASSNGPSTNVLAPAFGDLHGTETILIAEDHESIREMARQTLMNLGYRVLAAGDGVEAVGLCENEVPAIAILDVIMPRMGGPATGAKLTAQFDGIPILYTSGYAQDSESMAPAGDDARYLQKPYSPTTLGRLVREILDQAKTQKRSNAFNDRKQDCQSA